MDQQFLFNLIAGLFIGGTAGYLGSLMVLKRMSLVGDALSHVALPGMGIALLLHVNPFFGAFTFLVAAIFLIWLAEKKTKLSVEVLVGVMFTGSLAIGFLIIPEPEILETLFGDISRISFFDTMLTIIFSIAIFFLSTLIYKKLILTTISEDMAKAEGLKIELINLAYLILVATVVALGIKAVGALLMGALVIIPAAAAKNISASLTSYASFATFFGIFSTLSGIAIFKLTGFAPGPLIILTASGIFLVSIALRR